MFIVYASTYNLHIEHNKKVISVYRVPYIIANQLIMRDIFNQHVSSNFNNRLIRDAQKDIH